MLSAAVAKKLYIRRKKSDQVYKIDEIQKAEKTISKSSKNNKIEKVRKINELRSQFERIKINNFLLLIFDPIITSFCCCCKKSNLCGSFERLRLLTRASDKFGEELEVTNILNKLRNSYDIIKTLTEKQNSILLKFSKERVIELDETEDSDEEEDEPIEE